MLIKWTLMLYMLSFKGYVDHINTNVFFYQVYVD